MFYKIILLLLITGTLTACSFFKAQEKVNPSSETQNSTSTSEWTSSHELVVYKSPQCGCCAKWVDHMKTAGFKVKVIEKTNLQPIKNKYGIKKEHSSCHTGIINGYYISGHVPADDVKKLLKQKRKVAGLAVPGMPVGSPGMEVGHQHTPYKVLAITKDGKTSIFNSYQ